MIKIVIITLTVLISSLVAFTIIYSQRPASQETTPKSKDGGWNLVWSDEFNGKNGSKPDVNKWSYNLGTGVNYCIQEGWGNGEMEYYTDRTENSYIQDGKLIIKAIKEDYQEKLYTSARLVTKNKAEWTYGRFDIRAKLPHGVGLQGIWPAIWMLPTDNKYGNWPESGEIDIMEMVGRDPDKVFGTLHYGLPWQHPSESFKLPNEDYHEFALEWEESQIRFYVDNQLYGTRTKAEWYSTGRTNLAPFDQPFHLVLNVAVGGGYPGYPNIKSVFPQTMKVDYVRVYQKK
jgi:beta-glucanase (GH16 family)